MSITLILGNMFASKTSELFRRLNRARHAGKETILYKYSKDVRFGNERTFMASSHDGIHKDAIPIESFNDIRIPPSGTIVGIDEAQFMKGLCKFAEAAANGGCHIIATALSSDYLRNSFKRISKLLPKCDNLIMLHAVCVDCKEDAAFTKRIIESDDLEVIGGAEAYKPVCRKCYNSQSSST